MPTRLINFFLRTLREDPADAEVISHKLLFRAGYIRRSGAGLFAWLPLGLRVRKKIENIIHEEMERSGAQQVHFPALLPKEPYEKSGRWDEYGDAIFRLKDRTGGDYLLAPTHEEVFTLLVKDLYSSYKDLPLTIYQIQDKYRDETRPRAGLLRGREFSMKDGYSFDSSDEGLDKSYQAQRDAYERIFTRLGLDYVIVHADAGAMGGSRSEEFLHPSPIGEDTFVQNEAGYAANVEAFTSWPAAKLDAAAAPALSTVSTPGAATIDSLVAYLNENEPRADRPWQASDTLKTLALKLTNLDGSTELLVVAIPGDRDADLKRIEVAVAPAEVEPAVAVDLAKVPGLHAGYIGPVANGTQFLGETGSTKVRFLVDPLIAEGSAWVTGANIPDSHSLNVVYGRDFSADGTIEAASIKDGDLAPDGSGPVTISRGVEIGHIFQLGRKYAEALGLQVLDENGKLVTVTMGSYGIGVTRILALLAEANNDEKGLIWPPSVAPFDVHLVIAGKDEEPAAVAEQLALDLEKTGLTVLLDDRKANPGVKFADAELIGVPYVVVAGRKAAEGIVEFWDRRAGTKTDVTIGEVEGLLRG